MDIRMLKKYVDDILVAVVNLPLGSRFCRDTGTITRCQEDVLQDEGSNRTKDQVTIMVLQEVANRDTGTLRQ